MTLAKGRKIGMTSSLAIDWSNRGAPADDDHEHLKTIINEIKEELLDCSFQLMIDKVQGT